MPIYILVSLIISVLILILAIWVLLRNPVNPINFWYALTMVTTGFWGVIESLLLAGRNLEWIMVWGVISYACVPIIPFCFLHFTHHFPYKMSQFNFLARIGAVFLLLLSTVIAAIPGGVVKSAVLRPTYGDLTLNTVGWTVWAIVFFILFTWGYYNLFRKLRRSSGFSRRQLTHVITFTIIPVIIATIFDVVSPIFLGEVFAWIGVHSLLVAALGGFYYLTFFIKGVHIGSQ